MQTQNRTHRKPPTPNPRRKGRVQGRDRRWRRLGNCLGKTLHRHLHTNRTLDSLNNVDRPPCGLPRHQAHIESCWLKYMRHVNSDLSAPLPSVVLYVPARAQTVAKCLDEQNRSKTIGCAIASGLLSGFGGTTCAPSLKYPTGRGTMLRSMATPAHKLLLFYALSCTIE